MDTIQRAAGRRFAEKMTALISGAVDKISGLVAPIDGRLTVLADRMETFEHHVRDEITNSAEILNNRTEANAGRIREQVVVMGEGLAHQTEAQSQRIAGQITALGDSLSAQIDARNKILEDGMFTLGERVEALAAAKPSAPTTDPMAEFFAGLDEGLKP